VRGSEILQKNFENRANLRVMLVSEWWNHDGGSPPRGLLTREKIEKLEKSAECRLPEIRNWL
jgi:hypothetical protein